METNKIEKKLLDKELSGISEKFKKISKDLQSVFDKYGIIKGDHEKELSEYIAKFIISAGTMYRAGDFTIINSNTHPNHIPECLKKVVLDWAVKNFLEKFEEVREAVEYSE